MQQLMINLKDIFDPITAMNMALILIAKAFKLNYSTPTNNIKELHPTHVTGILHNQNANQNGNGNVVAARTEVNGDFDEIKEVNANCILMANLQQASTSGTQTDKALVYDLDGSAKEEQHTEILDPITEPHMIQQNNSNVISVESSVEHTGGTVEQHPATVEETHFKSLAKEADESLAKHKALEYEIEHLLRAIISQDIMSIVQSNSVVDTSNLQTELEPYNDMQQKIKQLQAQLGDLKGKSNDTPVSEQKDTTKGTSGNTKLAKQTIMRKQPSSSGTKLYFVTPLLKSKFIPKVVESNALSKLVTSHSVPNTRESKVMKNDNVIALGMFRINPSKTSRVDNVMPNKPVKASVRTKSITVSQPHVITKKDVNSNTNGLPFTGVESTAKTRRPQPRS
ncbi:hypothetical protein Tco_1305267, partial [Tanacetum coccineum]